MPPDLYEPWRPLPGQRVRVRRSLECPSSHHIADLSDDGLTGTIITTNRPFVPHHAYVVLYDNPVPTGIKFPACITAMRYAAIELEPADAAR